MKNILGTELISCSFDPLTGYFRNGYCQTDERDRGSHVVASVMSEEFLKFTKSVGNDLSTPNPIYNFPGLKSGDRWCLCALKERGIRYWFSTICNFRGYARESA